jgi:septation ring formation regulator EzrA
VTEETFHAPEVYLKQIAQDIKVMRQQMSDIVNYIRDAEAEVTEKMRRFVMYMHDIHDAVNQHMELGLNVPDHILREAERCDDRLRQLLNEAHSDTGTFERVRQEMAKDPENRWDHTRRLIKPRRITP